VKYDTKEPCKSCPYRMDAPLGLWHPSEFQNLARTERDQFGAVFGCHATRHRRTPSVCAGWLIQQRDAGVPSIALRLEILRAPDAAEALRTVRDGGHALYDSVEAMIEANETLGRCYECERYLSADGQCPEHGEDAL